MVGGSGVSVNASGNNGSSANESNHNAQDMRHRGQILRHIPSSVQESFHFHKLPRERNSIYQAPSIDVNDHQDHDDSSNVNSNNNVSNNHNTYKSKGLGMFQRMWPNLPMGVQQELGELVDFIARDYIYSWYHFVDDGVGYENEVEKRKRLNCNGSALPMTMPMPMPTIPISSQQHQQNVMKTTMMILSTTPTRTIPFLEIFYTSLATVLGKLSTTCENINVPHLVLVKFMHILKINVRTYKDIRKIVLQKQQNKKRYLWKKKQRQSQSQRLEQEKERERERECEQGGEEEGDGLEGDNSMEIAIIREYLQKGKLHRAITFGMDVPGLLFGDASGRECPVPPSHEMGKQHSAGQEEVQQQEEGQDQQQQQQQQRQTNEDAVLEQRLFGNDRRILHECEVDYNRVLSHRMCRILFPRADFASPVLRSACVELLASMILTPIMGCFTPDYINGWIKAAIVGKDDAPAKEEEPYKSASTSGHAGNDRGSRESASGDSEDRPGIEREPSCSMESHGDDLVDQFDDSDDEFEEELNVAAGSFDGHDHEAATEEAIMKSADPSRSMDTADEILALLAMSLIELQAHIDFDEAREAKDNGEQLETRWNDQGCIETARNLVLVIEAMLMHGVLIKRRKKRPMLSPPEMIDDSDPFSVSTNDDDDMMPRARSKEYTSLTVMLMELTSDLETFENETMEAADDKRIDIEAMYEEDTGDLRSIPRLKAGDLSTLRTLIAAWLHTGVVYRTLDVLLRSSASILHPFYHQNAFIRNQDSINGFLRLLRGLENVDILVDTMTVLSHPPLDLYQMEDERKMNEAATSGFFPATSSSAKKNAETEDGPKTASGRIQATLKTKLNDQKKNTFGMGESIKANFENNRKRLTRLVRPGEGRHFDSPLSKLSLSPRMGPFALALPLQLGNHSSPLHLEFHRNETLASNLRSERFERMTSFSKLNSDSTKNKMAQADMICRSRAVSEDHFLQHRDLHNLAKGFYSNTTLLKLNHFNVDTVGIEGGIGANNTKTILTMDNVTTRRKWAIPDDDSSFLLRAQPVHLNVVGVHRDQRSHNLSYKKYAAYFDEPIAHAKKNEFRGAKLRRQCFLRYYPNDRTAAINFIKSDHYLDSKLGRLIELETSGASKQINEFERYLCNKSFREGSERSGTNSILASTVMDSNDFSCVPRSGKASDFVYRVSLFEEPEVELSGKRFIVQDASYVGIHRADASSLEISDASLSASLLLGQTYDKRNKKQFHVDCDDKGVPIVYLKMADQSAVASSPLSVQHHRQQDGGDRPYRLSFVRAALLVTSSRKEAQLQVSFDVRFIICWFGSYSFIWFPQLPY